MSKERRQVEFRRRAFELARTGKYSDYSGIEAALAGEYPEAPHWLGRTGLREDLRAICLNARKGASNA